MVIYMSNNLFNCPLIPFLRVYRDIYPSIATVNWLTGHRLRVKVLIVDRYYTLHCGRIFEMFKKSFVQRHTYGGLYPEPAFAVPL